MLNFKQAAVNIDTINFKLVELTEDNIDEVIKHLHKAGYLAGRSNYRKQGIYFSRTGGMDEPNQTIVGELLVVEDNTWTRLKDKKFGLSDLAIQESIKRKYDSMIRREQ